MKQTTLIFGRPVLSLSSETLATRVSGAQESGDSVDTRPTFCDSREATTPSSKQGSSEGGSSILWSSDGGSSILSSVDAYARRSSQEKQIQGASEVRVQLRLRRVGGSSTIASELSLKRVAVMLPQLKSKRRCFDNDKKLEIIKLAEDKGVSHAINVVRMYAIPPAMSA
jgi:GTP cyclohydrolase II